MITITSKSSDKVVVAFLMPPQPYNHQQTKHTISECCEYCTIRSCNTLFLLSVRLKRTTPIAVSEQLLYIVNTINESNKKNISKLIINFSTNLVVLHTKLICVLKNRGNGNDLQTDCKWKRRIVERTQS